MTVDLSTLSISLGTLGTAILAIIRWLADGWLKRIKELEDKLSSLEKENIEMKGRIKGMQTENKHLQETIGKDIHEINNFMAEIKEEFKDLRGEIMNLKLNNK